MPGDDVDKFLEEQKAIEGRKQSLIDELLRQKAAAIKEFDDKLAKLGHVDGTARSRRSHHRKASAAPAGKPAAPKPAQARPGQERPKP
jgi:hypothetical protein